MAEEKKMKKLELTLEEYFRGKLNAPSGKGASFNYSVFKELGVADEFSGLISKLKARFDPVDHPLIERGIFKQGENFSIDPIPNVEEERIEQYIRLFYESLGLKFDEKGTRFSGSGVFFEIPPDKGLCVTYTVIQINPERGILLVTETFIDYLTKINFKTKSFDYLP